MARPGDTDPYSIVFAGTEPLGADGYGGAAALRGPVPQRAPVPGEQGPQPVQHQSGSRRPLQQQRKPPEQDSRHHGVRARQPRAPPGLPPQPAQPAQPAQRASNKFLAPFTPPSISPHPDHAMYPSYKFLEPNFVTEQTYRNQLRSWAAAQQQHSSLLRPQAPSAGPHPQPLRKRQQSPPRQAPKRLRTSPQQPQTPRPAAPRDAHEASPAVPPLPTPDWDDAQRIVYFPMPSPPHPAANFFPLLRPVPASRRRAGSKTESARLRNPPSQLQDAQQRPSSLEKASPEASYTEASGGQRRAGWKASTGNGTRIPARANGLSGQDGLPTPNGAVPGAVPGAAFSRTQPSAAVHACHTPATANDPAFGNALYIFGNEDSQQTEPPQSSSIHRSITDGTTEDECQELHKQTGPRVGALLQTDTRLLPYGHAAPVVILLNQPPFVDIVRDILNESQASQAFHHTFYSGTSHVAGPQDEDDPAWKRAFLQQHQESTQQPSVQAASSRPPSNLLVTRMPLAELPDAQFLVACVGKFSAHIQSLYPVMPLQRLGNLVSSFVRRYEVPAPQQQQQETGAACPGRMQAEAATELLVFALGSVCMAKLDKTPSESGPRFYAHATEILESMVGQTLQQDSRPPDPAHNARPPHMDHHGNPPGGRGGHGHTEAESTPQQSRLAEAHTAATATSTLVPSLDLARAYLLAALFCGQLAWLPDAAASVCNAASILLRLIRQPGGAGGPGAIQGVHGLSLVEYKQYPHMLTDDERQLVVLYWTCVQLEFEINGELGHAPSELLRYQTLVPLPTSDTGGAGQLLSEAGDQTTFSVHVCLREHRNNVYNETYKHNAQESSAQAAAASLKLQFKENPVSQPATPTSEKSLQTARARSAYWEGRSYAALPSLLPSQQHIDMAESADAVLSMTETIRAYHGVEDGHFVLPNAFGTAMLQCRYLLLLFAASRTLPAVRALVSDAVIAELVGGTLLSFHETAGPRGVLEAARQVLRAIQARLEPYWSQYAFAERSGLLAAPASAPTTFHGPTPELSLYCPPFSAVPELSTGVPTATTSSSFLSFPTPNTPHRVPSSAYEYDSPFGSPTSPATPASPSPRSAKLAPARRLFPLERSFLSPEVAHSPHPSVTSVPFQFVSAPPGPSPSRIVDVASLAGHLGLVNLAW